MLLLAHAALPGRIEAATVDHGLRKESAAEAAMVARVCGGLGVPHAVLAVEVAAGNLQSEARDARYAALAGWLAARGLGALATAHHADDQAETLIARLGRSSGVAGLAGVRPRGAVPGSEIPLLRPLLGWRRSELAAVITAAGITAVDDPSNHDPRFDRVRLRQALAGVDWLDPAAIAQSAAHLADADAAIEFAVGRAWAGVSDEGGSLRFRPGDLPVELRRRLAARMIAALASEGDGDGLRGRELDRLVSELDAGRSTTLRGVRASGGAEWLFFPAPPRR